MWRFKGTSGNNYFGLAIGFTVLAAAFGRWRNSGGAYNPAVGFGPCLIDTLVGGNSSLPMCGSILLDHLPEQFLGQPFSATRRSDTLKHIVT